MFGSMLMMHLGELAGTTRLLLVRVAVVLDLALDGLAVGDLRLADVGLDVELALHAVDQDVEVQLAHAGDDRLTGLFVGVDLERRVFLGEPLDRGAELLLVALGLRLDRDLDHGAGNVIDSRTICFLRIGQGLTRRGVLEAHHGDDLTGADRRDLCTLVGVHLVDLADPLLAALGHVDDRAAGLEATRVDAQVGQLAEVRVGRDLEGQGRRTARSPWAHGCRSWSRRGGRGP